jgi:hypothetical protein
MSAVFDVPQLYNDLLIISHSIAASEFKPALLKNDYGSMRTEHDRLVVFGRESMSCHITGDITLPIHSLNQRIADSFIRHMNKVPQGDDHESSYKRYESMATLPIGAALMRLCQATEPLELLTDGQLFSAGSLEANSALIDMVAQRFVKQGSGILTAAVHSAAPNTYLRCIELRAIRENPYFTGVQLLQSQHQKLATPLTDIPIDLLDTKHISVGEWLYSQKAQWWQRSVNQLVSYLNPHQGFDLTALDNDVITASSRFIGELYHAEKELRYLDNKPHLTPLEECEREAELLRLKEGVHLLAEFPAILNPVTQKNHVYDLTKMFVYDIPSDAKERRYVIGKDIDECCVDFVNDSVIALVERIEEQLAKKSNR